MATGTVSYSEPSYAKPQENPKLPWYRDNIDKYLLPQVRDLLETYSKIPQEQQSEHIHKIRERLWAIRTYPITGLGVFLVPYMSYSPALNEIITRIKSGAVFLDIGCYVGGDLRYLASKGAPSENLYGIDIANLWDISYDMFQDREKFRGHFIEADILSTDTPALKALQGNVDIISLSAVLHQWGWDDQLQAVKQIITFSKPGTIIVGHQVGNRTAGPRKLMPSAPETYKQDPVSFQRLWDQAGEDSQTEWKTEAWLKTWEEMQWDPKDMSWFEEGACVIEFVVTRMK